MCEIQFIKRLDKERISDIDISNFSQMMTIGSLSNSDAFGLFNSFCTFKRKGMYNLNTFDIDLLKLDNFIVGHNRYATGGSHKDNYNNHPFIKGDFVLVHNGVLNNDDDLRKSYNFDSKKIETDSFAIIFLISHYFNSSTGTRRERIIKGIKKGLKRIEGSYSCVLFDRKSKDIFYFKNDKTSFYFMKIKDKLLIGSTDKKKFFYLYKDFVQKPLKDYENRKELSIEDEKIYLITDKIGIKAVGTFKAKANKTITNFNYTYDRGEYETINKEYYNILETDDILKDSLGFLPHYRMNMDGTGIYIYGQSLEEINNIIRIFGDTAVYDAESKEIFINLGELYANFY